MMAGTKQTRPHRVVQDGNPVNTLAQHRHCWANDPKTGFLDPTWPREPDIEAARKLAIAYLPAADFADAEIGPFARGAFHRLFIISSSRVRTQYLMRVAIPVDPFFKTESEVATMEYVRERSSLPVPRVVAFASTASNPLGFEWILMERADGVPLDQVWDNMPLDAKTRLTDDFAHRMKQLLDIRFTLLGNIYFVDIWNQVGYAPLFDHHPRHNSGSIDVDIGGTDGNFVIGRMVSTRFFRDKRAVLRAERGPFRTARELALAETRLLGQRIRHLSPSPNDDYYCEVDEGLADGGDEVLQIFDQLEDAASTRVFPLSADDGPEDAKVLWHDDLSCMNVLVHPETYELTGVVDWESVSIVPAWETGRDGVPYFLRGLEVTEPPQVGTVSDEEEEGLTMIRKDWELVQLRRRYYGIVGPLYNPEAVSETTIRLKKELSELLGDFEDRWESVRYWLERQLDLKDDAYRGVGSGSNEEEEDEDEEDDDNDDDQDNVAGTKDRSDDDAKLSQHGDKSDAAGS